MFGLRVNSGHGKRGTGMQNAFAGMLKTSHDNRLRTQRCIPVTDAAELNRLQPLTRMERYAGCVGVDGAGSGWIAVWMAKGMLSHTVYASARSLIDAHRSATVVAVDIPVGLTDSGRRDADIQARKFVGGRRACSVFSAPVRGILDATSQQEASRRHRVIDQRGFGAQGFAILPKIREWDDLLRGDDAACAVVREVHPEVSFAALNGGLGLVPGKKTAAGSMIRMQLLSVVFGAGKVDRLKASVPRRLAGGDDVLDALVALWSAGRIACGQAGVLPDPVPHDSAGFPMAIWY